MDIVEFLRARLDEDEAGAQMAHAGPWVTDLDDEVDENVTDVGGQIAAWVRARPATIATRAHIARHDPARVLAEVAAKRRIVELHTTGSYRTYRCSNGDHIQEWQCERAGEPFEESRYCEVCGNECEELPVLVALYADHPDYDTEWT